VQFWVISLRCSTRQSCTPGPKSTGNYGRQVSTPAQSKSIETSWSKNVVMLRGMLQCPADFFQHVRRWAILYNSQAIWLNFTKPERRRSDIERSMLPMTDKSQIIAITSSASWKRHSRSATRSTSRVASLSNSFPFVGFYGSLPIILMPTLPVRFLPSCSRAMHINAGRLFSKAACGILTTCRILGPRSRSSVGVYCLGLRICSSRVFGIQESGNFVHSF
jgi:hypothetical protein